MALLVVHLLLVFSSLVKSGGAFCGNPIPGFNVLSSGVDITKMDLFPFGKTTLQGSKSRIISKTCSSRKKTLHGETYDFPDEVVSVVQNNRGQLGSKATVYRSYKDVKKEMSNAAGLSGNVGKFAFSLSGSYGTMQNSIMKNDKEIIDVTSNEFSHEVKLKLHRDGTHLSTYFKESLEDLEGLTYKEDRDYFKEFVDEYGTHYFESGIFGGRIRRYIETESNYSFYVSANDLQTQAELSFNGVSNSLGASFKFGTGSSTISTEFKDKSKAKTEYYGGIVNTLLEKGYEMWQPTVDKNPTLLSAKLKPLYELVTDAALKKEVKIAIDEYIMRNYLEELKRKVSNLFGKYDIAVIKKWLRSIQQLNKADLLDVKEVEALDKEIKHDFDLPEWFTKYTSVCLTWYARHDGHTTCNRVPGTSPKTFCAKPNNQTEVYFDRGGFRAQHGCMLQWSISSTSAPDWFKSTEICFLYKTDYYKTERTKVCAPVNKQTKAFEDLTYNYDVINDYQWSITIPKGAPSWFKKTEFCLHWKALAEYTNQYQCEGAGPSLCAAPGSWTSIYQEYTKGGFTGGCEMRFEWRMNHLKYVTQQ